MHQELYPPYSSFPFVVKWDTISHLTAMMACKLSLMGGWRIVGILDGHLRDQ